MAGLTAKQQKFVAEYLEHGNASAAYRAAYNCAGASDATIRREAHRLLENPNIAPTLAEARDNARQAAGITLESHLQRLNELSIKAESAEQFSAAIAAEVHRARAAGLEPPRPTPTIALVDKQAMDTALQRALQHAAEVQKRMAGRAERLGLNIDEADGDDE
jgi:phage terminase small subunit